MNRVNRNQSHRFRPFIQTTMTLIWKPDSNQNQRPAAVLVGRRKHLAKSIAINPYHTVCRCAKFEFGVIFYCFHTHIDFLVWTQPQTVWLKAWHRTTTNLNQVGLTVASKRTPSSQTVWGCAQNKIKLCVRIWPEYPDVGARTRNFGKRWKIECTQQPTQAITQAYLRISYMFYVDVDNEIIIS